MQKSVAADAATGMSATPAAFPILLALSFAHLLNDMMQSLVPAIYPLIKSAYNLDFGQVGLITFAFQLTACIFQPLVGLYTDKNPQSYSQVAGMGFTMFGLIVLATAASYPLLLFMPTDEAAAGMQQLAEKVRSKGAALFSAEPGLAERGRLPVLAADFPETDAIALIQSFYVFLTQLAAARGINVDRPPHLQKITRTR